MFSISVDEMVIVVVPDTGPAVYHVLPNDAEVRLRIDRLRLSLFQGRGKYVNASIMENKIRKTGAGAIS